MQSLADFLGTAPPKTSEDEVSERDFASADRLSGKDFAEAVLNSKEFRQYILNGIVLGDLAPAVVCRLMDHGWGKPIDRLEVRNKTNELELVSPEQLEQRALYLAQLARQVRETSVGQVREEQEQNDTLDTDYTRH